MNDFISDLLFPVDLTKESEVAFCVEKLERVSIVTIKMTSNDAIVTTSNHNEDFLTTVALIGLFGRFIWVCRHTIINYIQFLSRIGNLMSLYTGQSFLSLMELIFWTLRALKVIIVG